MPNLVNVVNFHPAGITVGPKPKPEPDSPRQRASAIVQVLQTTETSENLLEMVKRLPENITLEEFLLAACAVAGEDLAAAARQTEELGR